MILHATLVAQRRDGDWRGLLIRGRSGAGKSGLALQLMSLGWRLAADDRVLVWRCGDRLFGRAPERLDGLIEARTVGVYKIQTLRFVEIRRVADAAEAASPLDRVPEPSSVQIEGVDMPRIRLDLHAPTAAAAVGLWCGAESV